MFQIGERVIYGFHGVCTVADMEERVIDRKKTVYMVLEPVEKHSSRFYIPVHNAAAMSKVKRMLTAEEMGELLSSDDVRNGVWISEDKRRKTVYRDLISGGDRKNLIQMLYCTYRHRNQLTEEGKRIHICDDNFIRDAERLLIGEITMVMQMDENVAKHYLRTKLTDE